MIPIKIQIEEIGERMTFFWEMPPCENAKPNEIAFANEFAQRLTNLLAAIGQGHCGPGGALNLVQTSIESDLIEQRMKALRKLNQK